ncbi:MAG: nuclear transport factor 2 family protein [Candidatus Omnitrophota bacterium]
MEANAIETVKAFIEAINAHDVAALGSLMTEDHTFKDAGGGCTTGKDKMIPGWAQYNAMFPDFAIRVDDIFSDGILVAIFGSTSGTYNGIEGMKPENKVGGPAAWKAIVENGKIKLWQVYADYTETWKVVNANQ